VRWLCLAGAGTTVVEKVEPTMRKADRGAQHVYLRSWRCEGVSGQALPRGSFGSCEGSALFSVWGEGGGYKIAGSPDR
jgi:hypothetical protein